MIPHFDINRIKNSLDGSRRWMDYLPPILNFVPPRYFSQADLVLDESDRSFLTAFGARPRVVDGNVITGDTTIVFLSELKEGFSFDDLAIVTEERNIVKRLVTPQSARLTPLGQVLAKSVEMILPDFDWEEVAAYLEDYELNEEQFNIYDILFTTEGNYIVGDVVESLARFTPRYSNMVNTYTATIYEVSLNFVEFVAYYASRSKGSARDLVYLGTTLPGNYKINEKVSEYQAKVSLKGDPASIYDESFAPAGSRMRGSTERMEALGLLRFIFITSIGDPSNWIDRPIEETFGTPEVRIELDDLISIRKRLLDKVKSDRIYIDDREVYNFIFLGAIDKNQLTLFGD